MSLHSAAFVISCQHFVTRCLFLLSVSVPFPTEVGYFCCRVLYCSISGECHSDHTEEMMMISRMIVNSELSSGGTFTDFCSGAKSAESPFGSG